MRLQEIQLVHHLGEVIAGLGGLAEGEVLGIEVIGHGPITNPDVVNDRFTVSPPKLSADAAKTEERDPRQLPGRDLGGLGYRAGVSGQRINSTRWRRCP